jgi:hypothetical protein
MDAVVGIRVYYDGDRDTWLTGLVVDSSGSVVTVLDTTELIEALTVRVSGRGDFPATIRNFDPTTGAALLDIDAQGLVSAPLDAASVSPGEVILALWRDEEGKLQTRTKRASPSANAPDHLFALLSSYEARDLRVPVGAVIVSQEGHIAGLAHQVWSWFGDGGFGPRGPAREPSQPVVLFITALDLLDGVNTDAGIIPAALAYHGDGWLQFKDGPVTRKMSAQPVQQILYGLGNPVTFKGLGQTSPVTLRNEDGTFLELVYAQPRQLRTAKGDVLGKGRYIVLWWRRADGQPDLVLCGSQPGRIDAAYFAPTLGHIEGLMAHAPGSGDSLVIADRP